MAVAEKIYWSAFRIVESIVPVLCWKWIYTSIKGNDRLQRINTFLEERTSKLYCLFLSFALPKFTNAHLLQNEEPLIHLLQRRPHDVATDLLTTFIKPIIMSERSNLYQLEHHRRSKRRDRKDLVIGQKTREQLSKIKDEESGQDAITNCFQYVCSLYFASLKYVFNKPPMNWEKLAHAQVMDVKNWGSQTTFHLSDFGFLNFSAFKTLFILTRLKLSFQNFKLIHCQILPLTLELMFCGPELMN